MLRDTILIVDDQDLNRRILEAAFEKDYTLLFAADGEEALLTIREKRPDIVLLDIMMPVLDGWDVCKLMKTDPETAHIPVIFISALTRSEDKVRAFSCGADDYISKPISVPEARARVHRVLELQKSYSRITREIDLVAGLQSRLLPDDRQPPPGFGVGTYYRPSGKASGDFYDFFNTPSGRMRAVIADVSGHGAGAAFLMGIAHSLFRLGRTTEMPLARTVKLINDQLLEAIGETGDFLTLLAVEYDAANKTLDYVNAGHSPALLKTGDMVVKLDHTATVLGFFDQDIRTDQRLIQGGFSLFLFTDGCYEWTMPGQTMPGYDRFVDDMRLVMLKGGSPLKKLEATLSEAESRGADLRDDATALLLRTNTQER